MSCCWAVAANEDWRVFRYEGNLLIQRRRRRRRRSFRVNTANHRVCINNQNSPSVIRFVDCTIIWIWMNIIIICICDAKSMKWVLSELSACFRFVSDSWMNGAVAFWDLSEAFCQLCVVPRRPKCQQASVSVVPAARSLRSSKQIVWKCSIVSSISAVTASIQHLDQRKCRTVCISYVVLINTSLILSLLGQITLIMDTFETRGPLWHMIRLIRLLLRLMLGVGFAGNLLKSSNSRSSNESYSKAVIIPP